MMTLVYVNWEYNSESVQNFTEFSAGSNPSQKVCGFHNALNPKLA